MDYTKGERAITHHAGSVRISGCCQNGQDQRLNVPSNNKFLVTHPMTDQCSLASAIVWVGEYVTYINITYKLQNKLNSV
jgi:hypothetical protein